MPPGGRGKNNNNVDEIEDLRRKLAMLDGDRKAYYESSEWTQKQNKEKVQQLRKENKELRKVLADKEAADEVVVSKGLEDHPKERNALRNKPGSVAIVVMDEKVRDLVNILNKHKYMTTKKQKELEELQTQHAQMTKDSENAVATDAGESEEAQKLRNLENQLDKASLKCKEAEHIRKTYEQIKAKLEQEHANFETILNEMETEIKTRKAEKKELEAMRTDALISRDAAKDELEKQEKQVYAERRKREIELTEVRKEAEEKKIQQERIERRIAQRGSISEEVTMEQRQALSGEDEQAKIQQYDEAYKEIKDATGVSNIREVVVRFELQEETKEQLEGLKQENMKTIERLQEEKEKLKGEFEEMKYSGEAKLSSGQRHLEEFETHLSSEEQRRDEAQNRLKKSSDILVDVKSGVEHLSEKLKPLKAPSSQIQKAKISPSSDEYVLDQLSSCEEKLLKLMEELDGTWNGKDIAEVTKQMEEEEFLTSVDSKIPDHNTRIAIPTTVKETVFDDDEESGDDEDILTRNALKVQAQQLVDSKTKRRMGRKKKGAKK